MLDTIVLGNSVSQWLEAIALGLGIYLFLTVVVRWLPRRLGRLFERLPEKLERKLATTTAQQFVGLIERTQAYFRAAAAVYGGSVLLSLPEGVRAVLRDLFILAVMAQIAVWLSYLVETAIKNYVSKRRDRFDAGDITEIRWVTRIAKIAVWIVAVLVALDNIGVDVTALAAGLGIGGIAVALAAQSILGDLFSSLSIVIDKPFVIGDFIIVGDKMGAVESIGLKTTRVRSLTGELLVFSNSDLLGSRIHNYGGMKERRVAFSFGVVYQVPAEQLEAIPGWVRDIVESQKPVRFDRAHFKAYGDSALVFEVVYYVLSSDYALYMDIQQAINLELNRLFEERGIEFAYPTQTIYVAGDGVEAASTTA
jgi:small-conductance mechanosensitive channel